MASLALGPLSAIRLLRNRPAIFLASSPRRLVYKGSQDNDMAYGPRPTAIFPSGSSTGSSLRQPSIGSQNPQQSSALAARIAAKRSELENLKQLKELSGALAAQMGALEEKLTTLRDGTEAVACVLSNWDNVLRAINMASMKVPKPSNSEEDRGEAKNDEPQLPVTLVRIPVQHEETTGPKKENGGPES